MARWNKKLTPKQLLYLNARTAILQDNLDFCPALVEVRRLYAHWTPVKMKSVNPKHVVHERYHHGRIIGEIV
jgi:hypothetical protein